MINPSQTILTQYQTSPVITALLNNWNANLDPTPDLLNFYSTIWNIQTASGYGLDVWGRIVGVTRYVTYNLSDNWLGFNGTPYQPFGLGVFYNGSGLGSTTIALPDTVFQRMILLKAAANLTNCSAQSLNQLVSALYASEGRCYVVDNLNMTFTYIFKFYLSTLDYAMLSQPGILPRPSGVSFSILQGP
jgi:hypothetical protein